MKVAIFANAIASKMDEASIDNWYEEEKQKCMDEYLKEVCATKDYEAAEKRYEERLNKVIEKYNKLMENELKKK